MSRSALNFLTFFMVLTIAGLPPSAEAKKKGPPPKKVKKIVALGPVETGYVGFSGLEPAGVAELLRDRIKKELEKTGRYVVLIPREEPKQGEGEPVPPDAAGGTGSPAPGLESSQGSEDFPPSSTTPESVPAGAGVQQVDWKEFSKMMAEATKAMSGLMQGIPGGPGGPHRPVAAQSMFRFSVKTGGGEFSTGGAVGVAEMFTSSPLGLGDFQTQSTKILLTCVQQDPHDGHLVDQKMVEATKTEFLHLAGLQYYAMDQSADHERAFNKVFRKAVEKCVKWIDKKLSPLPWAGEVFRIEGGLAYINAGSAAGITTGQRLLVIQKEKVASQGVEFGVEEAAVGTLEVTEVKENYAIARPVSGAAPETGSQVHIATN